LATAQRTRIQIEGTRLARTPGDDANGDDITKCDAYELARMVSAVQLLFLPTIADLGGYPAGFDRSNFKFIVPPESNRMKWKTLKASIYWMCWVGEPIKSAWFRTSNKEMLFPNQCESSLGSTFGILRPSPSHRTGPPASVALRACFNERPFLLAN
jgi:hypothetical protein